MRFYGGDPLAWLRDVPVSVVQGMVDMIPRLSAEENLAGSTVTAVGHGTKPGSWIQRQRGAWERAARGRLAPVKASVADLRALGIAYVVAPKKESSGG